LSAAPVIILNIDGNEASRAARSEALRLAGYRVHEVLPEDDPLSLVEIIGQFCEAARRPSPDDPPADIAGHLRRRRNIAAVGQFNGRQAHDFNNLLHALRAGLELIQRRTSEPQIADLARRGLEAVTRGTQITQQLLTLSHLQRSDVAPVDINRLILGMKGLLERTVGSAITLDLALDPGIGAARTNADQLELAILNLAVNASEAMPQGGVLTLCTGAVDDDGTAGHGRFIEIKVLDTGTGMPSAVRERAFEPFFTTKAAGEGAGLGLAQADAIARQSGGAVRLESEVGHGTVVAITVPVAAA